jgi:hypothetical protein
MRLVLCSLIFAACAAGAEPPVTAVANVTWAANGPTSFVPAHAHAQATAQVTIDPTIIVHAVRVRDAKGRDQPGATAPTATRSDANQRAQTLVFPWGELTCTWSATATGLDATVAIAAGSAAISAISLDLAHLEVPGVVQNDQLWIDNQARLAGLTVPWAGGVVGFMNPEGAKPLVMALAPTGAGRVALRVNTQERMQPGNDEPQSPALATSQPRMVPAGGRDRFTFHLRFGPAGSDIAALCPEGFAQLRSEKPFLLRWPDRRPIGMLMLSEDHLRKPGNPRGWRFVDGYDCTLPTNQERFRKDLDACITGVIDNLKAFDAQGVIVWDLGGYEWPGVVYDGQADRVRELAPEMDACADALFKRFAAAGLSHGVCVRPTDLVPTKAPPPEYPWAQRFVVDPLSLLDRKITYAEQRWGSTLIYIDSNVPVWFTVMHELYRKHPQVLLNPEWENSDYWQVSAPFRTTQIGEAGTPATIRQVWPQAFALVVAEPPALQADWNTYRDLFAAGDVFFVKAWFGDDTERAMIQGFRRELAWLAGGAGGERYHAATAATSEAELLALLADADPLVVKRALETLAARATISDPEVTAQIVALTLDWPTTERAMLPAFARACLKPAAAAASALLIPAVTVGSDAGRQRRAVEALGFAAATPEATALLLDLAAQPNAPLRVTAITSLGRLRVAEAVIPFCRLVTQPASEATKDAQRAAFVALGAIGDRRAARTIHAVLTSNRQGELGVSNDLDRVLREVTGLPWDGWNRWKDIDLAPYPTLDP